MSGSGSTSTAHHSLNKTELIFVDGLPEWGIYWVSYQYTVPTLLSRIPTDYEFQVIITHIEISFIIMK